MIRIIADDDADEQSLLALHHDGRLSALFGNYAIQKPHPHAAGAFRTIAGGSTANTVTYTTGSPGYEIRVGRGGGGGTGGTNIGPAGRVTTA